MAFSLRNDQKGLLFAIAAPLFYAIRIAVLKAAPYANMETYLFFRIVFDFFLFLPFFFRYREKINFKKVHLHLGRAFFAVIAMYTSIYGVKHLYLADAILLESTLPLFIPLLYFIWYREKISKRILFSLLAGFLGVFFLLKPSVDLFYIASLASLLTALFTAITSISIRSLSKTEHPFAILFYYYVFCGIFSISPFISSWEGISSPLLWVYLLFVSLFGVLFQFANTRAYALLPPHVAGSFTYFSVFFGALLGGVFFGESLGKRELLGGAILIFSGLFVLNASQLKKVPEKG